MIKALLKKQWLESIAFLTRNKEGKSRSLQSTIGFSLLMLVGLGSICFLFFGMGSFLSAALVAQGLAWVYFAFMGTMATAFGVIGSVFTAKTKLYEAKDNDLLLSMPIPANVILLTRMVGLYLFTLLFEGLVFLPAIIAFFVTVGFSFPVLLGSLAVLLVMPFGALAVCCVLGWLLALIAAKLPAKNLMTMLFTVGFLALYFVGYSKINDLLTYVTVNGGTVGSAMKKWLYPFWKLGEASTGGALALLIYAGIFLGGFALVYLVVAKTYLRLATANRGGRKAKYKGEYKQGSALLSLVKKELLRFVKNPMIAMNCFLGTIFLLILPFIPLFSSELRALADALNADEVVSMLIAVVLCATVSMNMLSAASVSLEGENLWIVRSLPVPTEKILLAKVATHWLVTAIPAVFASVTLCIIFKIGVGYAIAALVAVLLFITFTAIIGLIINLKMPNLHWTNELVAVKQSASAVISMFAEWAAAALLVGGYFLFGKYLFAGGYFLVCIALLIATCCLLTVWIYKRGVKIFEGL